MGCNIEQALCPELRFLIACCQAEPTQEDADLIRNYLSQITNHKLRITAASRHGILPLVYKTLKNLYDNGQLPNNEYTNALITDAKHLYMSIVQRNMLMTGELIKIVRLLRENGIEALAFKGPALAQMAYGDITLRQFGDLDILVHRNTFRQIAEIMQAKGYEPLYPLKTFVGDKVLFDMNNDCPFYDTHRGLSVEIHWDFFRKLALPTQKLKPWEATEIVAINGVSVRTLRNETHLFYHALHGSKHIWERLGWIVDIDRFIRAVPDLNWDIMVAQAKELGALRMFLFGPALAHHFFRTPLPEKIAAMCEQARFDDLISFVIDEFNRENPTPEDSLVKLKKVIALRDSTYFKTITLLEFLFRPGINERRTVVLPDSLFWLYWPLRPIGMGWRFVFCRLLKLCAKGTG